MNKPDFVDGRANLNGELMSSNSQGMNSQEELNNIRDGIIDAANSGYREAINDMKYFDEPLLQLVTQAERAAQERLLSNLIEVARDYHDKYPDADYFDFAGLVAAERHKVQALQQPDTNEEKE